MIFSRGAVLDGRVDGASTACKRGIRVRRFAKACARARGAKQGLKQVCNTIKKTLRRAACFFFDVVAPALLTVKPGPWCASGAGWRRSSWRPWGGTCAATVRVAVGRTRDSEREEAAARRARLGEARRPRMPAEPRRPAALPSEPAREARRRRPHSLDAGLVPDRGRDEAQRGEPRGGEGRGADWNLVRLAAAAVRHGRPRRRRRGLCSSGCARRLVRVAPRAVEAGGDQNAA